MNATVQPNGYRLVFGADNSDTNLYALLQGSGHLSKQGNGKTTIYDTPGAAGITTSFSGSLAVNGGILNVLYTKSIPPTNNLLSPAVAFSLGGGLFMLENNTSQIVSQSFDQATITPGAGGLSTTSAQLSLSIANLDRSVPGGTVNFGVHADSSISLKTANTFGTILGGWATYAGSQFAVSAGNGSQAGAISGLATGSGSFATGGDVDAAGTANSAAVPITRSASILVRWRRSRRPPALP